MAQPAANSVTQKTANTTTQVVSNSEPVWWSRTKAGTEFLSDGLTVVASVIAIWLFVSKRREIRAFARGISNFVHQSSLAELRHKLERLSDLHAGDPDQREEIVSTLHDICGQIDGSPLLRLKLKELAEKIRTRTSSRRRALTEPDKRSLVSELRESLKHFDSMDYAEAMGEDGK